MTEALIGLAAMLALSFLRVPIAISMGLVGFLGLWWMRGLGPSMASATTVVYESGFQYTLSVVPLFILMGNFVTRAGMSKELYRAAYTFVGHLRGGLAMATVLACAGFGAICGSSIATAATMTKVAYPSMRDHGYSDELVGRHHRRRRHARHPDPALDHHGHLRDHDRDQHRQAVRRRRAAGPAWRWSCSASAVQYIVLARSGRRAARPSAPAGASGCRRCATSGPVAVLFIVVMGGIYGGVFTATEGAGIGARRRLLLRAGARRARPADAARGADRQRPHDGDAVRDPGRRADLLELRQLHDACRTDLQGSDHALAAQPDDGDGRDLRDLRRPRHGDGRAVDDPAHRFRCSSRSSPRLGMDPVWFGIIIVVVVQIGLISPPVGMNMFVVKSMLPGMTTQTDLSRRLAVRLGRGRAARDPGRVPLAQPGAAGAALKL